MSAMRRSGGYRIASFVSLACLATAAWLGARSAAMAGDVAARPGARGATRGQLLLRGEAPFGDNWQRMRLRDAQLGAAARQGRVPARTGVRVAVLRHGRRHEKQPSPIGGERDELFAAPVRRMPQTAGVAFNGVSLQGEISALGSGEAPPDTMGAIGPQHFVECVTGAVAIYSRAGSPLSTVSLDSFFTVTVNHVTYPRSSTLYPRVLYDVRSGHWFAEAVELGDDSGDQELILAVSATADPTGTWNKYVLPVGQPQSGGTSFITDYPTLGVDDNGVYAAVRIEPSNDTDFAKIVATPKASLIAGSPSLGAVTQFSNIDDMDSTPQPAHNQDEVAASDPAWFFSSSAFFMANLCYRTLTWSAGTPTLSATTELTTAAFADVPTAPAKGSTTNIDSGDTRLQMAVIRNGDAWCARTVGVNSSGGAASADRAGCEWFDLALNGSTGTVNQTGRVYDSASADPRFYYYPSIGVSGQGHAVLSFSGSKGSEFVGAYVTGRLFDDVPGSMGTIQQLRAGQASYTRNDANGVNRWGEYSSTTLDPIDDMSLWTIQEYATSAPSDSWGTSVGQFLAPAPHLVNPNATVTAGTNHALLELHGSGIYDPGDPYPHRLGVQLTGGTTNGFHNINITNEGSGHFTVTYDVSVDATPGPRDIVLTNPDGQSVTVTGGLTVQAGTANTIQFSSSVYSVKEDGDFIQIGVTRSGSLSGSSTVQYATSDGTATAGPDYVAATDTLTFMPNEASKTFTVIVFDETLLEGPETVNLTLSQVTGMGTRLGSTSTAVLTINDDTANCAPVNLTADGSSGSMQLSWTHQCQNADRQSIERTTLPAVNYSVLTTISTGSDGYEDTTAEPGVSYQYRIRAYKGDLFSDYSNEAAGMVPAAITAQFVQATYPAREGGSANITVSLSVPATEPLSVDYATTTGGTATAGSDYTPVTGTLQFSIGELAKSFSVGTFNDDFLEPGESVNLVLTNPVHVGLGSQSTAVLAIQDDPATTKPIGLNGTPVAASTIALAWVNNCNNATGFRVERKGAAGYTEIGTAATTALGHIDSYSDSTASPGVLYTYRVRAANGSLFSAYSGEFLTSIPTGGKITPAAKSVNFGVFKLAAAHGKTVAVKFTNKGNGNLAGQVQPYTGKFTIQEGFPTFNLAPHASLTLHVTFNPTATGIYNNAFFLSTTDPAHSLVKVTLKATVR